MVVTKGRAIFPRRADVSKQSAAVRSLLQNFGVMFSYIYLVFIYFLFVGFWRWFVFEFLEFGLEVYLLPLLSLFGPMRWAKYSSWGSNCCRIFDEMFSFSAGWPLSLRFWIYMGNFHFLLVVTCHRDLEFFSLSLGRAFFRQWDFEFIFFIFWLRVTLSTSMLR